jgi:hypothetical protein
MGEVYVMGEYLEVVDLSGYDLSERIGSGSSSPYDIKNQSKQLNCK